MNARKTLLPMAATVAVILILFPPLSSAPGSTSPDPPVEVTVYDAAQIANPDGPHLPNVGDVCATIAPVVDGADPEDLFGDVQQALLDAYDDVLVLLSLELKYVIVFDPYDGPVVICYEERSFRVDFPTGGTVTVDVEIGTYVSN